MNCQESDFMYAISPGMVSCNRVRGPRNTIAQFTREETEVVAVVESCERHLASFQSRAPQRRSARISRPVGLKL